MLKSIEKLLNSNLGIVRNASYQSRVALNSILQIIQDEVDEDYKIRSKVPPKYCRGYHKPMQSRTKGNYCKACRSLRAKERVCANCGKSKPLNLFDGDSPVCWVCEVLGQQ